MKTAETALAQIVAIYITIAYQESLLVYLAVYKWVNYFETTCVANDEDNTCLFEFRIISLE